VLFGFSLDYLVLVLLTFLVLDFVSSVTYYAKRVDGKNISKLFYSFTEAVACIQSSDILTWPTLFPRKMISKRRLR